MLYVEEFLTSFCMVKFQLEIANGNSEEKKDNLSINSARDRNKEKEREADGELLKKKKYKKLE